MPNDKLKNYLHLHLIVFIWGFTAVLGKLISIDAMPLVWFHMLIASSLVGVFILFKQYSLRVSNKTLLAMLTAGVIIEFLEPIWYGRKIIWFDGCFWFIPYF